MKRKNLASGAYEQIKRRILSLEYLPGSILQERGLAEELGISRTPVREAIHRLSQEGWLKINSRKNIRIRYVSAADLHEVFQARRILEREAMDLLIDDGSGREAVPMMSSVLSEMDNSRGSLFSFITADQSFHSILFQVKQVRSFMLFKSLHSPFATNKTKDHRGNIFI